MSATDEQIGRNVARLRSGQTQAQVADQMRARGWKWSQATVWSVEKGERPLRLAEAEDLARVLKQKSGSDFARGEWDTRLEETMVMVEQTHEVLEVAVDQYLDAQVDLAVAAGDDRVDDDQQARSTELVRLTPEQVVRDRRASHGFEEPEDSGPVFRALLRAYEDERG